MNNKGKKELQRISQLFYLSKEYRKSFNSPSTKFDFNSRLMGKQLIFSMLFELQTSRAKPHQTIIIIEIDPSKYQAMTFSRAIQLTTGMGQNENNI